MKKMNKKAVKITWEMVVGLIILLVATAVILLFYSYAYGGFGSDITRDTCHESIILRSAFNRGIIQGSEIFPLKCRTEKICIEDKDTCEEEFGKRTKENPVTNSNVNTREDIVKIVADAHWDCHSMVGEGLLDFMRHDWSGKPYGLICSRIVFSKNTQKILKDTGGEITYMELYNYMLKKQTPETKTSYLEALYGIGSETTLKTFFDKKFEEWGTATGADSENFARFRNLAINQWKIDSTKQYAIIAQMYPEGTWSAWLKAGGAAVAFAGIVYAIPTGGISILSSVGIFIGTRGSLAVGGIVLAKNNPTDKFVYVSPGLYPYDAKTLRSLNIYDFAFAP
jgi:hypothetical protein